MRHAPKALSWLLGPDALLAGAVALLALSLRLAWALYSQADPLDGRFDDSLLYHLLAIGLRNDHQYVIPFSGLPTAQWPPGYPAFLASLYTIFGVSVVVAKVASAVLGALTTTVLYMLGRQLFDRLTAALGALFLALMPGQIFFTGILWSEVLFSFLYLSALLGIALMPQRPARERLAWAAGVGLLAAASAYVREAGLSLLPVALLYWGWALRAWRPALGWAGAATLVAALLIAPWAVRNVVKLDAFVALSSSTGVNFWRGHHEGATGGFDPIGPLLAKSKPRTEPGGEIDILQRGMREGLQFLVRHPLQELNLAKNKTRLLYQGDTIGLTLAEAFDSQPFVHTRLRTVLHHLANGVYDLVLALAGLAMVRWALRRGDQPLLPVVAIAVLTMGYVAFWGDPRFHFPLVPLLCLLAGWWLAGFWQARPWPLHAHQRGR